MSNPQPPASGQPLPIRADARGSCIGDCGDGIEMILELHQETICRVAFRCDGCAHTLLAATGAAELAQDQPLSKALHLTAVDVMDHMGDVPEDHEHCALIAVNALHEAIADALRTRRDPWKRLYRPR